MQEKGLNSMSFVYEIPIKVFQGGRKAEVLFNGYRVSHWQDKKVLEMLFHSNVNTFNTGELNS